jgi:hypothetical protein
MNIWLKPNPRGKKPWDLGGTVSKIEAPSQYQKYQQLRLANNLAQDELETAQMSSWGPGLWGFPE